MDELKIMLLIIQTKFKKQNQTLKTVNRIQSSNHCECDSASVSHSQSHSDIRASIELTEMLLTKCHLRCSFTEQFLFSLKSQKITTENMERSVDSVSVCDFSAVLPGCHSGVVGKSKI